MTIHPLNSPIHPLRDITLSHVIKQTLQKEK